MKRIIGIIGLIGLAGSAMATPRLPPTTPEPSALLMTGIGIILVFGYIMYRSIRGK